jgi:hypothetical protein
MDSGDISEWNDRPVPHCSQYTHDEMLFKRGIIVAKECRLAGARPAMQENQGKIGGGYSVKPDALRNAANGNRFMLAILPGMTFSVSSRNGAVWTPPLHGRSNTAAAV